MLLGKWGSFRIGSSHLVVSAKTFTALEYAKNMCRGMNVRHPPWVLMFEQVFPSWWCCGRIRCPLSLADRCRSGGVSLEGYSLAELASVVLCPGIHKDADTSFCLHRGKPRHSAFFSRMDCILLKMEPEYISPSLSYFCQAPSQKAEKSSSRR